MSVREYFEEVATGLAVKGFLHTPEGGSGNAVALTHGAGANCSSRLLVALAEQFCNSGMTVLRFDLPFRQLKAHGPPIRGSADRDQQGIKQAIRALRRVTGGRVCAGGHSYGGRQVTMLAAEEPEIADGLLLLSYPLHPPKKPEQLRTAHFSKLRTPALFVHGTKDGFGTLEEVKAHLDEIPARTSLLGVSGAGHELLTAKNPELPKVIVSAFCEFFG